jgi:hypothetical protein
VFSCAQAIGRARARTDKEEATVLVRAGDGEWLPLEPVDGLTLDGLRALCGPDAAHMLEFDSPLPVVAFGPWPDGAASTVDAVCLTQDGRIELLVSTFDEDPRDTLWRLMGVAGALRGTTVEAFAHHCTELGGEPSVARWLQARVGGDVQELERRLADALAAGDFGFMLVTPRGAGRLTQPLAWLQAGRTRVRVFELELLRAGPVQAVEGMEVPLDAGEKAPEPVELRLVESVSEPAPPAPVMAALEPRPEPAAHEPVAAAPEPPVPALVAAPEPPPAPEPTPAHGPESIQIEPSTVQAFLAGVDRLDHRASSNLRWLHESLLSLVDEAEYTTDGELEHVAGWLHGQERLALFGLDSQGLLQLVISTLPNGERAEFAAELAGLLPDTDGAEFVAAGFAEVDIPGHLDDQTLLEYLVDNLVEALPGGRAKFGTSPTAEDETAADDFFAGVSAEHDPAEVQEAFAGIGNAHPAQQDEPAAKDVPTSPDSSSEPAHQQAGSRWLRRRAA